MMLKLLQVLIQAFIVSPLLQLLIQASMVVTINKTFDKISLEQLTSQCQRHTLFQSHLYHL